MMRLKNISLNASLIILLCGMQAIGFAQRETLSLSEAYILLEKQYPLLNNDLILEQIYLLEIEKLDLAKRPDVNWKADARMQSGSVKLDLPEGSMLDLNISQPLLSAKTYAEAQYTILDGGLNDAQRSLKAVALEAEKQGLEVDKFVLRERVNQLFLNILLLREQNKIFDFTISDLTTRMEQVAAGVENGILLESELIKMEVKAAEINGQQENLTFRLSGMIQSLSDLLNIDLSSNVVLELPALPDPSDIPTLNRPEQKMFQLQQKTILAQSAMIDAIGKPKLGAFAQAGIGYPNPLNFLDSGITPYAFVGAQFSWPITDWGKAKKDKEILTLQAQKIQNTAETFDFNMQTKEANYLSEVRRLQALIKNDAHIANLQASILDQLAAQLEEGIITSSEYIFQANEELKSRQSLAIHQTELIMLQINFWNERGGY